MSKEFYIEKQGEQGNPNYKDEILRIINDAEQSVRAIEPDKILHSEVHKQKMVDARKEVQEFESVRKNVCECFEVPYDSSHIYLHDNGSQTRPKEQRAFRAFFVLINALTRESYYGEGRIDHNTLLMNLIPKLSGFDSGELNSDTVFDGIEADPPAFLMFKGFVSTEDDNFQTLSPTSHRVLETPVYDKDGNKIETPANWFITGHNTKLSS